MTFIDKDGQEIKVAVSKGDNLLDIAQAHDIEMEGTETSSHREGNNSISRGGMTKLTSMDHRCLWWVLCMLDMPCNCTGRRILRKDPRAG